MLPMLPPLPHLHLHVLDLIWASAHVLQDYFPLNLGNVLRFLLLLVVKVHRHGEELGRIKLLEFMEDEVPAGSEGAAHLVLRLTPPGAEAEAHHCRFGPGGGACGRSSTRRASCISLSRKGDDSSS